MKRLNWGWSITMVLALLVGCSGAEEKQKVPIPSNKMVEAPQNSATTSTEKNGVDGESPPNGPGAEVPALPNSPGGSAASVPDHNDATGAAPGGGRPLGSDPQKFTRDLPGGHEQQLPDRALGGLDPLTPNEAMEKGIGSLKRRDAQLGEPVVILAGMGPHGVPIVAESTDPADLDPDTPALIIDGTTRDPATTYADCLGLLQVCAERTTTMDGCVDAVSTCKTERPWEAGEACCPGGAIDDYRARRRAGEVWAEAFVQAFANGRHHFPGLSRIYEDAGL